MPKSKSKRRRYQPPPHKKRKPSPRWFGWTILGVMGLSLGMRLDPEELERVRAQYERAGEV